MVLTLRYCAAAAECVSLVKNALGVEQRFRIFKSFGTICNGAEHLADLNKVDFVCMQTNVVVRRVLHGEAPQRVHAVGANQPQWALQMSCSIAVPPRGSWPFGSASRCIPVEFSLRRLAFACHLLSNVLRFVSNSRPQPPKQSLPRMRHPRLP